MSKTFTLTLRDNDAVRVERLTKQFGGTVPGFAASLASDISRLPMAEIVRVRQEINTLAAAYETKREQLLSEQ